MNTTVGGAPQPPTGARCQRSSPTILTKPLTNPLASPAANPAINSVSNPTLRQLRNPARTPVGMPQRQVATDGAGYDD